MDILHYRACLFLCLVPYNFTMNKVKLFLILSIGGLILSLSSCATELPSLVHRDHIGDNLVVGRVLTVSTGERARRYAPELRFFELEAEDTSHRYQIDVRSADQFFVVDLPPGRYQLTRIQISEGPFMSMADVDMKFSVGAGTITHVGGWRFGIASPQYGRMLIVSASMDEEETTRVREFLAEHYSLVNMHSMVVSVPQPSQIEARLYEVMPYPRYPRYFRRHWW